MVTRVSILAAIFCACFASLSMAAPSGWALDYNGILKTVDLNGPSVVTNGATGIGGSQLGGLAISGASQLFATDNGGNLYTVANNGALSLVGNTGVTGLRGLDFNSTNTLMIAMDSAAPANFWQITPGGVASYLSTSNLTGGSIESIAVASNTTAYVLRVNGTSSTDFGRLNLGSGVITLLSNIPNRVEGLDFASDGNLYALGWTGKTYQIDPFTGAYTMTVNTGGEDWAALAAAIPEPTGLCPMGIAAMLGLRRRRSRVA
jgi:hypothetical protein